jgi:hypothetical protein
VNVDISLVVRDCAGRTALLSLNGQSASLVALKLEDVEALARFVPENVTEVIIHADRFDLRSIVEQVAAEVTIRPEVNAAGVS